LGFTALRLPAPELEMQLEERLDAKSADTRPYEGLSHRRSVPHQKSIRDPALAIRVRALHGYLVLAERLSEEPSRFPSGWNFGPAETDAKPVEWMGQRRVMDSRFWRPSPESQFP
jgi:hypothetical protein